MRSRPNDKEFRCREFYGNFHPRDPFLRRHRPTLLAYDLFDVTEKILAFRDLIQLMTDLSIFCIASLSDIGQIDLHSFAGFDLIDAAAFNLMSDRMDGALQNFSDRVNGLILLQHELDFYPIGQT